MKGLGFWESPSQVKEQLTKGGLSGLNTNCFSTFAALPFAGPKGNEHQISRVSGMGLPEVIFERLKEKNKSLLRSEDITKLEWEEIDPHHAKGAFEFDAFYGSGRIIFRSVNNNGEWVINHMAVPRKGAADDDNPYVVFEFSGDEIEKLCQPVK
jgi:hypothetical protein